MKLKRLLLVVAYFLFLAGCKEVKEPEFKRVDSFGLRKIDFKQATIGFSVTYFNPNSFGVNVKEAEADIYMDSVYMGKFKQDSTINVQKESDFSIPFSGSIPLSKALSLNFQNIGHRNILLKADGSVKVGKAGIYISKDIHYQGMHSLDEIKLK